MPKGADPFVDTTAKTLIAPAIVLETVVMPAHRCIVAGARGAALGVGRGVIDVAVGRWHATSREGAASVTRFDVPPIGSSGSAAGHTRVEVLACGCVGDRVPPLGIGLIEGDLSRDIGDHRREAVEFARMA